MSKEKESLILIQTISTCILNKTKIFINKIQSLSQSVFTETLLPPAGCAAQLHMIAIQTIFIYVNFFFLKYMATLFKA